MSSLAAPRPAFTRPALPILAQLVFSLFALIGLALPGAAQAATVEIVDIWGNPATEFGYHHPLRFRVVDETANDPSVVDQVSVDVTALSGEVETVSCREIDRTSGIFEGEIQAFDYGGAYPQNGFLQIAADEMVTVSYDDGNGPITAQATSRLVQVFFIGADGKPLATVGEGELLHIELLGPYESNDVWQRDTLQVEVTRSGGMDTEIVQLLETTASSGVYVGTLQMASDTVASGDGVLESSPLPSTLSATYWRDFWPFLTAVGSASVVGATLEIIDVYGNPVESISTELRVRLYEHFFQQSSGLEEVLVEAANDLSGDIEQIVLREGSPGVFESASPLAVTLGTSNADDGLLSAPVGSVTTVTYVLPSAETVSVQTPTGPSLILLHGDMTTATSFLYGEPLRIEVRYAGADVSAARDTVWVDVYSDVAADFETVELTETSEASGIFRGKIETSFWTFSGASENGTVEEGFGYSILDAIHVVYTGGGSTLQADAPIDLPSIEALDTAGRPATAFASGATLRLHVKDFSIGSAANVDALVVVATCGGYDYEQILLREIAADSFVFEADLPVRFASTISHNKRLECAGVGDIFLSHSDYQYPYEYSSVVGLLDTMIEFLDEQGRPTREALDGRRVKLRVTGSVDNPQPLVFDTVTVQVTSGNTLDSESVVLRETTVSSGIFEGEVWISSQPTGNPQVDVAVGPGPLFLPDQIRATYSVVESFAEVVTARIAFFDEEGRELSSVRPDDFFWVRIDMPSFGSPTEEDVIYGSSSWLPGYSEPFQAIETGVNTGVFLAGMTLDGNYLAQPPEGLFGAFYDTPYGTISRVVPIVAYQVRFLDDAGAEITSLPVGRPIRVELVRPPSLDNLGQWDQLEVTVRSEVSGDVEALVLNEEEANRAGPLRGTLPMLAGMTYLGDGTLEAGINSPFGDTVSVELGGAPGILATAPLRRPEIRFEDANGNEVSELILGRIYTVEVEDSSFDTTAGFDTLSVYLYPYNTGLSMWLDLFETGPSTGVFRAQLMPNEPYGAAPPPNVTQIGLMEGELLSALHTFSGDTGSAEAVVEVRLRGDLEIVDAAGNPVSDVLEGAPIRIRFTDVSNGYGLLESRNVTVGSRLSGDIETLTLWETAVGSGIFERSLPSRFYLGAGGQSEDGELGLAADPQLQVATGETVVVHYEDSYTQEEIDITRPTTAVRFSVHESDGSMAVAVTPDFERPLKLRLESPTLARAGQSATFVVSVDNTGDIETFTVSGLPSGLFEVTVPFSFDYSSYPGNGNVSVYPGSTVTFRYELSYGHQGALEKTLPVAGAVLKFVDPQSGEALVRANDSRPFKVQLFDSSHDPYFIETRSLTLTTSLGQDSEEIVLTETNTYSGVFEAIVQPRLQAGYAGDGMLTIGRLVGPAGGLYDQVVATHLYQRYTWTVITATLPLDGPTLAWTDAAGNPSETIQWGNDAHLQVDDASRDLDPGVAESLSVQIDEMPYGTETLTLTETGPSTGIFRGSIPVVLGTPSVDDGQLQVLEFGSTRFVYSMPGIGSLSRWASVTGIELTFIDAVGNPTTSYLEGETLRLRLRRSDLSGGSPTEIDQTSVQVQSIYWGLDSESVTLTETSVASGIFEGAIPSALAPAEYQNGILEIGRGGTLDAIVATSGTSGEASARVDLIGGKLRLLDRVGRPLSGLLGGQILGVELTRLVGGDPAKADTLVDAIDLASLGIYNSDIESLTLVETGPETGIYVGTIGTTFDPANFSDGILQVDLQGIVRASFEDLGSSLDASAPLLYGQAPITEPDYLEMAAGTSVPLDVLANDYDWDSSLLTLVGTTNGAFVSTSIGNDNTLILTTAPDAAGSETLTYLVSDESGAISEGLVYLYYDSPPTVTITSPEPGTIFASQADVILTATAMDLDDGDISGFIEWSSDLQGNLSYGSTLYIPAEYLAVGTHVITASVTDNRGYVGSATTTIVIDGIPYFEVMVPQEFGQLFQEGTNTFLAAADDMEDGDLSASVVWTSLEHGPLGTGAELEVELQPGSDVITVSVADSQGNSLSVERPIYVNARPTVEIVQPVDGALLPEAEFYELEALVADLEESNLPVEWTLDNVILPDTYPHTGLAMAPGPHTVSIRVIDNNGGEATDTVSFTVLGRPTLTVTTPDPYPVITLGESLDFAGTAADFEDGDLSAQISWVSDRDGQIGVGAAFTATGLTAGDHIVTVSVTDSDSFTVSATLYVYVQLPPSIQLLLPTEGAVFAPGDSVGFAASATDPEAGDLTEQIQWSSSIDGALGTGGGFSLTTLTAGTHLITASVADVLGAVASASVTITINSAPSVSIAAPASGTTVTQGSSVTFTGTASDPEDGNLASQIAWSSSLDGALGSGASIATSSLSLGTHVITASVTDSHGSPASVTVTITINAAPTVAITAPAGGSSYVEGAAVSFTGTASDSEDGNLASQIAWSSSLDGALGSGTSLNTSALSVGIHLITASVTDSAGATATASVGVTITANSAPNVSITSPSSGTTVTQGSSVTFAGTASDPEDGNLASQIAWSSSLDGALGSGASIATSALSLGAHVITASVTDSHGSPASVTVTITINAAPTVAITAPAGGSSYVEGASVSFTGTASDSEDGNLAAQIAWSSSLDGALGSGATLSTSSLSVGSHLITASVTDSAGAIATASVAVTITANSAPSVSITSPSSGVWVAVGESVSFAGSAVDAESGDLSAGLVWTSNLDGLIGSGASFETSGLSAGSHTVTAAVVDPLGAAGSATVTVEVKVVQTATFISAGPEDGFVLESSENSGVGGIASTGQLRLGDDKKRKQYRSFLSFDTSALPDNAVIRQVTLRAYRSGTTGTNPAITHGDLLADIKTGYFGGSSALQSDDFADVATVEADFVVTPAPANGQWSVGTFSASGRDALSFDGTTQIRLRFEIEDDGDNGNDYLDHYGGESTVASTRPQLVVEYLE